MPNSPFFKIREKVNVRRLPRLVFSLCGAASSLFRTDLIRISPFGFRVLSALLAAFLFLTSVPGNTAEQKTTEAPKAPAPPPPKTIPLEEIAARATEVSNLVDAFRAKLVSTPEVEVIGKLVSQVSGNIDLELAATTNILIEQPTLESLQTQEEIWQRRQQQLSGWLKVLTARAGQLQGILNHLTDLQKTWTDTRAAAQAAKAPESILEQINATLGAINAAPAPLQEQLSAMLDLQSRVAKEAARCGNVLAQIDRYQAQAVARIMVRDSPPIWSAELWAHPLLPERIPKVAITYWAGIVAYLRDPAAPMQRYLGLFLLLALAFCLTRLQMRRWAAAGETQSSNTMVFDRPLAAALFITLFAATSPYSEVPIRVRQVFQIMGFAPMIILTHPVVEASLVPVLYALGLLFTIDTVRQAFDGAQLIGQVMLVFETLAGLVAAGWLLRNLRRSHADAETGSRLPVLRLGAYVLLFTFAAALAAGTTGFVHLAGLLTSGIIAGGGIALALYAFVRVISGLVAFALRVWPLRKLRMVVHHRAILERRLYRLFLWMAVLGWVQRYLDYVGLLEPTIALGRAVLAAKLERGSISISVGDVLAFFVTVLAAYLLSTFIRFVLEEDIYPRAGVAPGVSYAASSLLHYVIIAIGFVIAIGVLGVDLTKVTVLAGAFGVGIGFGLQSVVNNFVSGLILLFERPIHVGDTVQVGSLLGRVLRIGIRASIVRTAQGAEIIVPNAQLITQEVTNWTLSDQTRRVDLPVGVSYGTASKKVIELLEGVARAHPQVLKNPAPRALFMGYGDSSINFELRAWVEFTNWQQVHSDLTVAVYDAVYAAGMSFPFPQRDVHIVSSSDSKSIEPPANDGDKETGEKDVSLESTRRK